VVGYIKSNYRNICQHSITLLSHFLSINIDLTLHASTKTTFDLYEIASFKSCTLIVLMLI